jgi:NYN domain
MIVNMAIILHNQIAGAEPVDGRVLHLLDIENLLGGPTFTLADARSIRAVYAATAPTGVVNQVVLATSHHAAAPAWFAWPQSARRLVRSGPDGADLALIDVIATERLAERFDRVVIGSGDGIFALVAKWLEGAGVRVTVVARRGSLSGALRRAVSDIRPIDVTQEGVAEPGSAA